MVTINRIIFLFIWMIGKNTVTGNIEGNVLNIVNGVDAQPGEIPYIVSLRKGDMLFHFCSGSILNERYVITAGHCVYNQSIESIRVSAGSIYLNKPTSIHSVIKIYLHPRFNAPTRVTYLENDIALIKVDPTFEFDDAVAAVVLPRNQTLPNVGSKVLVAGWGKLKRRWSITPNTLKKLEAKVVSKSYCNNLYGTIERSIAKNQFCTHHIEYNITKGVCIGDSGGPLTINNNVLVGIVSWSRKDPDCGSPYFPDVHTQVAKYYEWILQNAV